MRYQFIDAHARVWPITLMCRVLQVTTSGYYAWKRKPHSYQIRQDEKYGPIVRRIFDANKGCYGAPRITEEMRDLGHRVNEKRVSRLMKEMGLKAVQGRKFKPVTTQADPEGPVFPDLVNQDFTTEKPNKIWVGDITYLETAEGFVYLATVIDLFSRKVVGWAMGDTLEAKLAVDALKMAVRHRWPEAGVIFHSDRGCQYTSQLFRDTCVDYGVRQSMGRTGCCYDNAVAESFFHSMKVEWLHCHEFQSREEVRQVVFEYIESYYNKRRRHSTLGYLSPETFEKRFHKREKEMASRHNAPPRSAAQRAPDQKAGPNGCVTEGPSNHRETAIRPPARRSVPAPSGCLLPAGTETL